MVIEPDMTNATTITVRFTVNRNGVVIDMPRRRIFVSGRLLLPLFPAARRIINMAGGLICGR